eukprot:gene32485-39275_t
MSKKDKFRQKNKQPFYSSHGGSGTKRIFSKKNDKKKDKQSLPPTPTPSASSSSVYKRIPSYPKPFPQLSSFKNFIKPTHDLFEALVSTSYEGFLYEPGANCGASFSEQFQHSLLQLDRLGYYQFDMTQPGGLNTKVAKTFVSRCLVGDAGMTYKYLGLRMFAFPWTPQSVGTNADLVTIGQLNQALIQRTSTLLKEQSKSAVGSCAYNITLINRCYGPQDVKLKKEAMFEKDLCTVSWHADSGLEHYSSIAVYHFEKPPLPSPPSPWKVGLRVLINAEGPQQNKPPLYPTPQSLPPKPTGTTNSSPPASMALIPPVCVTLPSECVYYLLDDFNHHHQHCVLAGGGDRYASTHRVAPVEGHSYMYIKGRVEAVAGVRSAGAEEEGGEDDEGGARNSRAGVTAMEKLSLSSKYIRKVSAVLMEVEMDWVRQFYVQGRKHFDQHVWWHGPMSVLEGGMKGCEQKMGVLVRSLHAASVDPTELRSIVEKLGSSLRKKVSKLVGEVKRGANDIMEVYDDMIEQLSELRKKRFGWEEREKDPIFATVGPECQPLPLPTHLFSELLDLAKEYGYRERSQRDSFSHLDFLVEKVKQWKETRRHQFPPEKKA